MRSLYSLRQEIARNLTRLQKPYQLSTYYNKHSSISTINFERHWEQYSKRLYVTPSLMVLGLAACFFDDENKNDFKQKILNELLLKTSTKNMEKLSKILSFYGVGSGVKISKISYGSSAEVFRIHSFPPKILKVIKVDGNADQDTIEDIWTEMIISLRLNQLRFNQDSVTRNNASNGFGLLNQLHLAQDSDIPKAIVEARIKFAEEIDDSESESESETVNNQMYAVLEFEDVGEDLGSIDMDEKQAGSIILQIILSIAAAESEFKFEHRDLHPGNILIKKTNEKTILNKVNGRYFTVATHGVKVSMIDYAYSRMSDDSDVIYRDLSTANNSEFNRPEILGLMRTLLENNWEHSELYTNIIWIHYIAICIIAGKLESAKSSQLWDYYRSLLQYKSATNFVEENQELFTPGKRRQNSKKGSKKKKSKKDRFTQRLLLIE